MSEKTGRKPTSKRRQRRLPEIENDFVLRPDGMYNFWQYRFVKGHSYGIDNPVWVLKGVYNKIPRWAFP